MKWVRKAQSLGRELNDWEARSSMQLALPGMWKGVRGEAWHATMCRARMWRSCTAMVLQEEMSQLVHATVGVFSHPAATCVCCRSIRFSRVSQCGSNPAISRLELDREPVGLELDQSCCWIAGRKGKCHTIGGRFCVMPNQTPPTLALDVSQ